MSSLPEPDAAIAEVFAPLWGEPVFGVGSAIVEAFYRKRGKAPGAWKDVDLFTPSTGVFISAVQILIDSGCTVDTDNDHDLVWYRYKHYGMKDWGNYSIKLHTRSDIQVNVVHKIHNGHATTTLHEALGSFDMGLLGLGWDLRLRTFHDLRGYWFGDRYDLDGSTFPGVPERMDVWKKGEFSQHTGLRQGYRYADYTVNKGYDLHLMTPDLIEGYENKAARLAGRKKADKVLLSEIYARTAQLLKQDQLQELLDSYKLLEFDNPLDEILEALF